MGFMFHWPLVNDNYDNIRNDSIFIDIATLKNYIKKDTRTLNSFGWRPNNSRKIRITIQIPYSFFKKRNHFHTLCRCATKPWLKVNLFGIMVRWYLFFKKMTQIYTIHFYYKRSFSFKINNKLHEFNIY
jgi:hypothetical protein